MAKKKHQPKRARTTRRTREICMPQINIHVLENDSNGEQAGSFVEPHPKVRVAKYDNINFNLINARGTFVVKWNGFSSPFASANDITPATGAQQVVNSGLFHYAVQVTTGSGAVYTMDNCPEVDVP